MIRAIAPLALLLAATASGAAPKPDPRILVDATVNGRPVKLCFDTGCDLDLVLFRKSVERLGIPAGRDSKVKVSFGIPAIAEGEAMGAAHVLDVAGLTGFDGILGWRCVRAPVLRVDTDALTVSFLTEPPEGVSEWMGFPLAKDSSVLCLLCPGAGGRNLRVYIDTGLLGTLLSRDRWNAFRAEHPDLPLTLTGGYSPAAGGTYVSRVALAANLRLGPLEFGSLLVEESAFTSEQFAGHDAILGMRALRRFDVVIDLRGERVYLKRRKAPPEPPDYNRLGAVFVPKTLEHDELVAHVLPESPAARAGLRSGDVLLAVDGRDYTSWRKNPKLLTEDRVAEHPAGTRHVFTVSRGDRKLDIAVVLEDILAVPKEAAGEK